MFNDFLVSVFCGICTFRISVLTICVFGIFCNMLILHYVLSVLFVISVSCIASNLYFLYSILDVFCLSLKKSFIRMFDYFSFEFSLLLPCF